MELGEALEIVYHLANKTALDIENVKDDAILEKVAQRQGEALDIVHDYIVNHHKED
jgi:hypothetical protein